MQNLFSILGKFFRGLSIFLSIIHHIIWIIIGGAILIGIFYIMSVGPSKLIQQAIPTQLLGGLTQGGGSSQGGNSSSQNSNQNSQQSTTPKITDQQKQCAINIIGSTRINQLLSGGQPTPQEILKIQHCFPNGIQF